MTYITEIFSLPNDNLLITTKHIMFYNYKLIVKVLNILIYTN